MVVGAEGVAMSTLYILEDRCKKYSVNFESVCSHSDNLINCIVYSFCK